MILDGFPKVLWINLDRSRKRALYMEELLSQHGIINTRIKAVDGVDIRDPELNSICYINRRLTRTENACTCSHIKALKYFVESMEDECVVIFEDDVSFEFLPLIPFDWPELMKNLPKDYEVIQLAITHENGDISNVLVKTDPSMKYYCSAAYLITKTGAKKLLDRYYSQEYGKIILYSQEHATADSMLLSTGATYSIPIFTYHTTESTIHPWHLKSHNKSKNQQLELWKNVRKTNPNNHSPNYMKN
ncbi:glycosyl transferase family protein [Tupanvirus deep ocean]|uniref:Glycosyl transferase family protein n=2 Tax=Tupanvirus TaxID=2094720 RepID=A0AC62A6T0_9VIRU|nr:glycosyl transferase family protein [Tupanvirus deep ocean]QKU33490.1 glycosyl transferase family protein [Tupanvirus deep ocean]